ncbi:restriction endonuclease subunit S [Segatella copri]|nr:restriction endonuclease subunit S [Segatella copri]
MEWKEVTLGDFMQCNPKRTIKKGQKARKITMDLLIPHSKTIRNWNYEPYSGGAKFQNGDTIMARITPCLENGKHAFVSILDEGEIAYGSTEYFVFCGKEKVSDNDFVYYLTKTPLFRDTAIKSMVGSSGRQRAQMDVLENLKMFVPKDISDQRRIASILSSLDRKIELNNKINADLEEMAQAIFKNWFVDFEPFKDGKFVDSELGMIPEGWKVGCLGDMGAVVCGKTPSKSNSNYYGGDIPFIKIPDMHGNVFVENSEDRLTEEGSLSQIKKFIPPYSLMVSCIATVGLVSINTKPSHTNQQINTVIPHNKSALFYLYQYIKNNEELLKNMGRGGTTTLNVNTRSFSNIRLLIPSEIALEQFHRVVEGLFKKIELNLHESRTLSLLRDTLLPRLMSGELEVPE